MHRSDVNLPPRSFVHSPNLGAKMAAVPIPFPILLCDLSDFIRVAAMGQHKKHIGYDKICSDATYHISCSMVRHISLKVFSPLLANMASAFRFIAAFPPPRGSVRPKVKVPECGRGNEEPDLHLTWTCSRSLPRKKTRSRSQKALMMRSGHQVRRLAKTASITLSRRLIALYSDWPRFLPRALWAQMSQDA